MKPVQHWQRLSGPQIESFIDQQTIAILPIGATEQHGPHLPTGVDSFIAEDVIQQAAEQLDTELSVLILPTFNYGRSIEHEGFHGTISLNQNTLFTVLMEIAQSLGHQGLRRFLILNAHGGNYQVIGLAIREMRVKLDMFSVQCDWDDLINRSLDGLDLKENHFGIHGGKIETSMMLNSHPELVDMNQAQDFRSMGYEIAKSNEVFRLTGPVITGWHISDLNPKGACGNAASASAEFGATIMRDVSAKLALLIKEMDQFELGNL